MDQAREMAVADIEYVFKVFKSRSDNKDNGIFHEILCDIAQNAFDMYTPIQDNKEYGRDEPVLYSPSPEEWTNFGTLMENLHRMDVNKVGVALLTLPAETPGLGLPLATTKYSLNGKKYEVRLDKNNPDYFRCTLSQSGAFYLSTDQKKQEPYYHMEVEIERDQRRTSSAELWTDKFEQKVSAIFTCPVYAAEKDVDTRQHRKDYQLYPESCIHPLQGNRLDATKSMIGGIHTPWLYVSSGPFTLFTMHKEDADATALNVLHGGDSKAWTTIAPHHARKFETMMANDLKVKEVDTICDNWIRELGIYVPHRTLDEHKVHYCSFEQSVGQVVITFQQVYHQGVNLGPNVAEAVNYGDKYWSPASAKFCADMACRHMGTLRHADWKMREDGQPPIPIGIREFSVTERVPNIAKRVLETTAMSTLDQPEQTTSGPKRPRTRPHKHQRYESRTDISNSRHPRQAAAQSHRHPASPEKVSAEAVPYAPKLKSKAVQNQQRFSAECDSKDDKIEWRAGHQTTTSIQKFIAQELLQLSSGRYPRLRDTVGRQTVGAIFTAFGSVEAFIELRSALTSLRADTNTVISSSEGPIQRLTRLLDRWETDSHYSSFRERFLLAQFAEIIEHRRRGERTRRDVKMKTVVYEALMKEAYPDLQKPADRSEDHKEWSRKYNKLVGRYAWGKRWLRLAETASETASKTTPKLCLLFLPRNGTHAIQNREFCKLNAEAFDILLWYLDKYKREFLLEISKRLEQLISVDLDGNLRVPKQRTKLELAEIDHIMSLFELSPDLSDLIAQ